MKSIIIGVATSLLVFGVSFAAITGGKGSLPINAGSSTGYGVFDPCPTGQTIVGSSTTSLGWACQAIPTGSGASVTSTVSASNSTDKGIQANCPAGKIVIGGGAAISTTSVNLSSSNPSGTAAWYAFGNEEGTVAGNWTITAYAICATP